MAFEENISQFFDEDDFAQHAQITINNVQKTVKVILNTPTMDVQIYDTEIVADSPNFICATADISGLKTNSQVTIGGKSYKVKKITDDGTGMSTVYLS